VGAACGAGVEGAFKGGAGPSGAGTTGTPARCWGRALRAKRGHHPHGTPAVQTPPSPLPVPSGALQRSTNLPWAVSAYSFPLSYPRMGLRATPVKQREWLRPSEPGFLLLCHRCPLPCGRRARRSVRPEGRGCGGRTWCWSRAPGVPRPHSPTYAHPPPLPCCCISKELSSTLCWPLPPPPSSLPLHTPSPLILSSSHPLTLYLSPSHPLPLTLSPSILHTCDC